MKSPALYPAFLKLAGRKCLVVGAGMVAQGKIEGLLASEAAVRVVAPQATAKIEALAREGKIAWERRPFVRSDLDEVFLVIVATDSAETNRQIFHEAQSRRVLCNVVDDPAHCDFYYPAVVRRGALQIAISTAGLSPALGQRLRQELEQQFGPDYESWLEHLGEQRTRLFATDMNPEQRRLRLHELASSAAWQDYLQQKKNSEER